MAPQSCARRGRLTWPLAAELPSAPIEPSADEMANSSRHDVTTFCGVPRTSYAASASVRITSCVGVDISSTRRRQHGGGSRTISLLRLRTHFSGRLRHERTPPPPQIAACCFCAAASSTDNNDSMAKLSVLRLILDATARRKSAAPLLAFRLHRPSKTASGAARLAVLARLAAAARCCLPDGNHRTDAGALLGCLPPL